MTTIRLMEVSELISALGEKVSNSDLTTALAGKVDTSDLWITEVPLPATDLTAAGITSLETVGESVVFGDLLYRKSDGKWWKSDADAELTMPGMRLALETVNADANCKMLCIGWARKDSWNWTVGSGSGNILFADTTAGLMTQNAPSGTGDQIQVVGIICQTNLIWFSPSPVLAEIA